LLAAIFKKKKKKLMTIIIIIMMMERNVRKGRWRDVEEKVYTYGGVGGREAGEEGVENEREGK
jgi:hypothetical protein